ncbi:hypothetical protein VMY22_22 [Bacillus phage VMY22]|uniref:Uncharacterized protein n=1 Tax=Bacillus phage VMY22 TaxID=1734382 RepID=A0A0N9SK15_9CAUD|nr:hypothetical protein VMY22_22 [Bacillus phage VMY22]ALH46487.1 hypothetical protein VMY22_22 [Bacillus phage VMY22]
MEHKQMHTRMGERNDRRNHHPITKKTKGEIEMKMTNEDYLFLLKQCKDKYLISDFGKYLQVTQLIIVSFETGDKHLLQRTIIIYELKERA